MIPFTLHVSAARGEVGWERVQEHWKGVEVVKTRYTDLERRSVNVGRTHDEGGGIEEKTE
jgi:hypothetical protein